MNSSIWATLGIAPTNDVGEIRRGYARRLKQVHPEDDPQGFQTLREAYDHATRLARNGWAVPLPDEDEELEPDDAGAWPEEVERAWTRPTFAAAEAWPSDTAEAPDDHWRRAAPASRSMVAPDAPEEVRAELARERELAEAHGALCDQLATLVSNPDGDRQEALATLLRLLRSPGMDSLDTHARTERWLAHLVTVRGPVVDDMIEPLIQFFGWDSRAVAVDLTHAMPVLQRRDSAAALLRLERPYDPDHDAWRALCDEPTPRSRLQARFSPGLAARVFMLLDRIEHEFPRLASRLNPRAEAWWRGRQARPDLSPAFLWTLVVAPLFAAAVGNASGVFGPPAWPTLSALWTVFGSSLLVIGLGWVHGFVRPRRRWRDEGRGWSAPLWLRLGWAPVAAVLLALSAVAPVSLPWVAAYWLVLGPLVLWTRIVSAHLEDGGLGRRAELFAALPLLAWLVIHGHGAQFVSLCWAAAGVTMVAHAGRTALQEAWLDLDKGQRRGIATGFAVACAAAAGVVVVAPDWPIRALGAAFVALVVLAARPIRLLQPPAAMSLWLRWMRFGWVVCLVAALVLQPSQVMAVTTFVAMGVWLAAGALLTALWEAAPHLEALISGRRKRIDGLS